MYIVKVIGGIWDGRIFRIENKYIIDKLIRSLEYEGDGFERCEISIE